jgi:hypothetical protein
VGGPGRGKTASAILMGVLAGYSLRDLKRAIQHGQPQMTVTDLFGNPLPKDLVGADSMDNIRIAWRKWLGMRVKIIDEYNRIPTRTQSALLTVMGDNYAELLDQVFECPEAAWYLTANDDAGRRHVPRDRGPARPHRRHGPSARTSTLASWASCWAPRGRGAARGGGAPRDRLHRGRPRPAEPGDPGGHRARADVRRRLETFASQFELCEGQGRSSST